MKHKFTVLLVEDDKTACNEIITAAENTEDFTVIGVTNSETTALEIIEDSMPDIIILDLELQLGSGNGLNLLYALQNIKPAKPPYILITTNNLSSVTYDAAHLLGADFIMSKHQTDYSAKAVFDFLKITGAAIKSKQAAVSSDMPELPVQKKNRLSERIKTELDLIGVSPKSIGYQYLHDAILLVTDGKRQNIYACLAEKYKKTDASIARAMQNAINRAWRISDIEDLLRYYTARISSEKGTPTTTEFIFYYANKISG